MLNQRTGRPQNRDSILDRETTVFLLQSVQIGSGANPASYSDGIRGCVTGGKTGLKAHAVSRLRINGTVPSLPICTHGVHRTTLHMKHNNGICKHFSIIHAFYTSLRKRNLKLTGNINCSFSTFVFQMCLVAQFSWRRKHTCSVGGCFKFGSSLYSS
jgi:hypothetical protein